MLTTTQQQFLELLRAGLWNTPADPDRFTKGTDWKTIYRISREQTVTAVIADALETLPPAQRPPQQIAQRFIIDKINIARTHTILNHTLNTIVKELDSNGIPHILLKGQGVAQNYPNPTSRTCGDIDLYVGEKNIYKACDIIVKSIPGATDDTPPVKGEHHHHINIGNVTVEIHQKADMIEFPPFDSKFQKWTKEQLDNNFADTDKLDPWDNNGITIYRAPIEFDSIFILTHMLRHMIHGGVGFRQLCDWSMFLHNHAGKINEKTIIKVIQAQSLGPVWQGFSNIAIQHLGFNASDFVIPINQNKKIAEKLIEQIFISGNFGHFDKNKKDETQTTYLKGKLRSFKFLSRRLMILFPIFPTYISLTFIGWIWNSCHKLAHRN